MKLRWSNGHSYAIEFTAVSDTTESMDTALTALSEYRQHQPKRYHNGRTHTNEIYFSRAELHFYDGRQWFQLNQRFYQPERICPTIENCKLLDAVDLLSIWPDIYRDILNTSEYCLRLRKFFSDFGTSLAMMTDIDAAIDAAERSLTNDKTSNE